MNHFSSKLGWLPTNKYEDHLIARNIRILARNPKILSLGLIAELVDLKEEEIYDLSSIESSCPTALTNACAFARKVIETRIKSHEAFFYAFSQAADGRWWHELHIIDPINDTCHISVEYLT